VTAPAQPFLFWSGTLGPLVVYTVLVAPLMGAKYTRHSAARGQVRGACRSMGLVKLRADYRTLMNLKEEAHGGMLDSELVKDWLCL
jgi:hypothetical protein